MLGQSFEIRFDRFSVAGDQDAGIFHVVPHVAHLSPHWPFQFIVYVCSQTYFLSNAKWCVSQLSAVLADFFF